MKEKPSTLEESKKRLASAFENLENLIEKKLVEKDPKTRDIDAVIDELDKAKLKNKELNDKFDLLDKEYKNMRHICVEVVEDLSSYITNLEDILEKKKES